jgi:virginiamycin A acetyltransferase
VRKAADVQAVSADAAAESGSRRGGTALAFDRIMHVAEFRVETEFLRIPLQGRTMKATLKIVADLLALLCVLPLFAVYRLLGLLFGVTRAFPGWSQLMSLFPGLLGAYLRRAFYRLALRGCGSGSWISFGTVFSHPTAAVGRDVYVGVFCCLGDVTLEDDVLIGSHVSIMNGTGQHGIERLDVPIREQPGTWPRVTIGRDSWVGDRAVVMADVGAHCVIGAGSVVTKPIPDYAIAVGSPARVVRYRDGSNRRDAEAQREKRGRRRGRPFCFSLCLCASVVS